MALLFTSTITVEIIAISLNNEHPRITTSEKVAEWEEYFGEHSNNDGVRYHYNIPLSVLSNTIKL